MYAYSLPIGIYWIGVFIYIIVLYIKGIKSKDIRKFKKINKVSLLSIVGVIIYEILYSILDKSNDLGIVLVWIIGIVAGILFIISFITNIITSKMLKNKIKDSRSKFTNIGLISVIIFYLLFTTIGISPLINDLIRRDRYSKYIISYLNKKYGDKNYRVSSIRDERGNLWDAKDSYIYLLHSDYMKNPFEVEIGVYSKKIEDVSFLNSYYIEKKICGDNSSLHKCINEYIENDYSEKLIHGVDYLPTLVINFREEDITEDFGRIPEVQEIVKYTKDISFYRFRIYKTFTVNDEEEFKQYVIDMYKDYKKYFEQYHKHVDKTKIDFQFNYKNPFSNEKKYKNGGYIRETNDGITVYYKNEPITITNDELNK